MVEIHLCYDVNGGDTINRWLFGWEVGEETSDISTIGRRVRDVLINLYFTT